MNGGAHRSEHDEVRAYSQRLIAETQRAVADAQQAYEDAHAAYLQALETLEKIRLAHLKVWPH